MFLFYRLGNAYIYPGLDWANPDQIAILVVGSSLALFFIFLLVVGLVAIRDAVAKKCTPSKTVSKTVSIIPDHF